MLLLHTCLWKSTGWFYCESIKLCIYGIYYIWQYPYQQTAFQSSDFELVFVFILDSSPFFSFNNKSNMVLIKPSSATWEKTLTSCPRLTTEDLLCWKQWNCILAQRSLGTRLGKRRSAFTFNFESIRHGLSTLCHWPVRMKEHKTKLF